jgi:AraC-like DNA-binding protein
MLNGLFSGMVRMAGAGALAVALAVFSAMGQDGDSASKKAAADTTVRKSGADTLTKTAVVDMPVKKAAADSLTKTSSGIDSSAKKPALDSLAKTVAVDTSAKKSGVDSLTKTAAVDTSDGKTGADSLAGTAAIDTSAGKTGDDSLTNVMTVDIPGSNSAIDSQMSVFDEFDEPPPSENGFWASVAANMFYVIFFGVSLAVIVATLYFYLTRRDTRRFLTTTRLSVLDRMVQKGCRYIESNYSNLSLTVSDVCNELVTGEAYLDVLFEKELGITVKDFITQVRVNNIKNMLVTTASPDLEKICVQCGFPDRASAERCFAGLNGGVGIAEFARALYMEKK